MPLDVFIKEQKPRGGWGYTPPPQACKGSGEKKLTLRWIVTGAIAPFLPGTACLRSAVLSCLGPFLKILVFLQIL